MLQSGHSDLLDVQRKDHRLILLAMREADVERATQMMQAHLRNFSTTLVARLQKHQAAEPISDPTTTNLS